MLFRAKAAIFVSSMSKKTIIFLSVLAAVLVVAIACGLVMLYSPLGSSREDEARTRTDYDGILAAIPEDASAVSCFSSLGRACELLSDKGKIYDALLFDSQSAAMLRIIDSLAVPGGLRLSGSRAVISLHYSGNLIPLLAADVPEHLDEAGLKALADSIGLACAIVRHDGRTLALVSTSSTLTGSASRHLDEGASIMDDKAFRSCICSLDGDELLLWSNDCAQRFLASWMTRRYQKYADFLKDVADWTGFAVSSGTGEDALLKGQLRSDGDADAFSRLFAGQKPSSSALADVLPASVSFALTLPLSDASAFASDREDYIDSKGQLTRHRRTLTALKTATGLGMGEWIVRNDIREVSAISWISADGETMSAVLVRCAAASRKEVSSEAEPYPFASYAAEAFGSAFSLADESWCVRMGGWVASGSREAVSDLLSHRADTVRMTRPFPDGECLAAAMVATDLCDAEALFRPAFAKAVGRTLKGHGAQTATLIVKADGLTAEVKHTPLPELPVSGALSKNVLDIPSGPFPVTNCATGKTNTLYQNSHLSICLKDENGKDLWGVPFSDRICGRVEEVDWYGNGKIQFLFAAGTRLYLIDRLGRYVSGFPVDLGVEVVLGPDVYDFTGAHGYTVMVLLADGSLQRYDLHGSKPAGWQGIRPSSPAAGLPRLLTIAGVRYWLVPTVRGDELYPFAGGERVTDKKTLNQISK